jgi:gluconate 2-dehydrogenase gamma chain
MATYAFLNVDEAAFLDTAVARLIPADDRWPGARESGVTNYIDKQMASAWAGGEHLYRSGPRQPGTPGQGYQLRQTPAELFRTPIGAINREFAAGGTTFAKSSPAEQDAYLRSIESDDRSLGGVQAKQFFAELWQSTLDRA